MKNTLEINSRSLSLITIAEFFFPDYMNNEELIRECGGMNGVQINEFLESYRNSKILETRYCSCSEFVNTYKDNETPALERLFQEKMSSGKLEKLKCKDPVAIYELHQKDPTIPFNHFTSYFL